MKRRRKARPVLSNAQPELPLPVAPKRRLSGSLAPEVAARVAIARRAKSSAIPGYVRLLLTLDVRRDLAEKLSLRAIQEGRNIEAILVALLEATAKDW